jgi:hypothetical protein
MQRLDDLLDPRMIRCHAVPHQPERRRQPLDQVDASSVMLLGQNVRRVNPSRSSSDDSDAQIPHEYPQL